MYPSACDPMPGIMPSGRMDHPEIHDPHPLMGDVPAALGERAAHTISKDPLSHSPSLFCNLLLPKTCRLSAAMKPSAIQVGLD